MAGGRGGGGPKTHWTRHGHTKIHAEKHTNTPARTRRFTAVSAQNNRQIASLQRRMENGGGGGREKHIAPVKLFENTCSCARGKMHDETYRSSKVK